MRNRNLEKIARLSEIGIFTAPEASIALSISQPTLYRLEQEGVIEKVARGLFVHPKADVNFEHLDYIIASKTFGKSSVIGGFTGLAFYNLVEEVPQKIWVLVPPEKTKSTAQKNYRVIRSKASLKIEVDKFPQFKVVSLERALVEGLRLRKKIGERIVFRAIREALEDEKTSEDKLAGAARKLGLLSVLEKQWEIITA